MTIVNTPVGPSVKERENKYYYTVYSSEMPHRKYFDKNESPMTSWPH